MKRETANNWRRRLKEVLIEYFKTHPQDWVSPWDFRWVPQKDARIDYDSPAYKELESRGNGVYRTWSREHICAVIREFWECGLLEVRDATRIGEYSSGYGYRKTQRLVNVKEYRWKGSTQEEEMDQGTVATGRAKPEKRFLVFLNDPEVREANGLVVRPNEPGMAPELLTEEEAVSIARHFAGKNPGREYLIMEAVKKAAVQNVVIETI